MTDRPLIAVDCDGVLYCWDRTARYMLREKMKREGRTVLPALKEPSNHWYAIKNEVEPEDWDWLWTEGVEQGLFRHGDVMGGAIFGLQALHEFADLMIVTSRPEQGVYDTMSWLVHHLRQSVPLMGVHILSHGQAKSTATPTPDLLIDDGPHNMEDWIENTDRLFLLFDQPWNKGCKADHMNTYRVFGWDDAVEKAQEWLRLGGFPCQEYPGDTETAWSPKHREVI